MKAILVREGRRLRVITPYVPELLTEMKSVVPYYARDYEPDSRHWLIDADQEDVLRETLETWFEVVIVIVVSEDEALRREQAARRAGAAPPPPPPRGAHSSDECARIVRGVWKEESALFLLPGAPRDVVVAAYRALCKMLHPDVSGRDTHAEMVKVNLAYDALSKRFAR